MLFNSYEFIFIFLPFSLFAYYSILRYFSNTSAVYFLVVASLFFYGWWDYRYIPIIISSIMFNYYIGLSIQRSLSRPILVFGIFLNLALLGYFKYVSFFMDNINLVLDAGISFQEIALPLAISFFTFQQIAYLVDSYKDKVNPISLREYSLFVLFFPQLIAGPIVHHKEMMPQFLEHKKAYFNYQMFVTGLFLFALGLFKKVVIADNIALFSTPVFLAAEAGFDLSLWEAWGGALAYTFQLYFDFSGYADMAIGAALLFGIKLPLNFWSPYKSINIIEFWRRWHMTLSSFLKDYIYIPLGGSRSGELIKYKNLMITKFLGGLWHGAGWNFVIWGGLHGIYLLINHIWIRMTNNRDFLPSSFNWLGLFISWTTTFIAIVFAWVFFRAESVNGAFEMISSMIQFSDLANAKEILYAIQTGSEVGHFGSATGYLFIIALIATVVIMPNSTEIVHALDQKTALGLGNFKKPQTLSILSAVLKVHSLTIPVLAGCFVTSILLLTRVTEFIYFRF